MQEYQKPEMEIINFTTMNVVMDDDSVVGGDQGVVSDPFG